MAGNTRYFIGKTLKSGLENVSETPPGKCLIPMRLYNDDSNILLLPQIIQNNSELKTMEENSSLVHMPRTRKPKIIVSISIIIWETPKPFPLNLT